MRRSEILTPGAATDIGPLRVSTVPEPAVVKVSPGGRAVAMAAVRACRPRQWTKNALVLCAPAAAGILGGGAVIGQVAGAVVAFCMLSSATYLFNDVRDLEQDRHHPSKRRRPIASGALPVRLALALAVALALAGLALAAAVRVELGLVGCGYLLLTAAYSVWLRRVIVVDMLAIAGGFVLRAIAGGAATDVGLSRWFLLVTSFGAIFVVAGKRHAELYGRRHEGLAGLTRSTLRRYSEPALRTALAATAAATLVAYALWVCGRPEHGPWFAITIVPVVLWLARYARLVGQGAGEAPEELILGDHALLLLSLVWAALFVGGVYVGG